MGGSEQKYITETLASNWVTSLGPNLTLFEDRLEDYLGAGAVAALNSGTSAIHLGLILLGVQAGDEVLCQTMTFSASANPILYLGATPVFIDSEEQTWNICPVALELAIQDRIQKGKKPKAIIAVLFFLLVIGCKKTQTDPETVNWDVKKIEIANKVKEDIKKLKAILPLTI